MKAFICILCPTGCAITPRGGDAAEGFDGARCAKGVEYARQEMTDPRRTLSSLVKVTCGGRELVGVRLTNPIPKARIADAMALIRGLTAASPVAPGQTLAKNILGLDCDIVAIDRA